MSEASREVHVALPMLNLVPGGMGGTETYLRGLTHGLASRDDIQVHAFVPRAAAGATVGVPETVIRSVSGGESTQQRLVSIGRAAGSLALGREIRAVSDVIHFPFTVPVPSPRGRPYAVTLHDIQHRDLPDFFSLPERLYRRATYDRAARKADAVITDSEFCRRRIVHHLGIPASRIHVAHLAVAPGFSCERAEREEFVLYPARRWPHKNHGRLLAAMEMLRETRPDLRLVLTGGGDPVPGAPEWVEQRGLVTQEELAGLYRTAGCLAFPSLYEGFGLPPLEAMASGCPVAVADSGSLPEVCGEAGILFDPLDIVDIARGIEAALDAGDRLVERGLQRAATFTWKRCADIHADVYRELASR